MKLMMVPIEKIRQHGCTAPSAEFLQSIKSEKVRVPVGLESVDFGEYEILYGKRRVFGADWAGFTEIPAVVFEKGEFLGESDREYLLLIENLHRSPNPVEELRAIQTIMKRGNLTMKEIAINLHVKRSRLKRIERLAKVCDEGLERLAKGELDENTAVQLSRLPREKQLEMLSNEEVKVTQKLVEDAIRVHNLSATQPYISAGLESLPVMNPLLKEFESVAMKLGVLKNMRPEVAAAISTLRLFIQANEVSHSHYEEKVAA